VTYKNGTLQYNGKAVLSSNVSPFFSNGLNLGARKSGDKVVFTFDATAGTASADASSCQEDTLTNTGFATITGMTGQQSSATVKTTCTPPKQNGFTYTCNKFTVAVDDITRKATVTEFDATSDNSNAKLTNVVVDWGDGSVNTVTADQATSQAHIFTTDSSTITATGQFTVNGATTPVSSTSCTQQVSFTTPQSTPTPPTPTLPNTGAGDTIALFMGAIVAGTIGFRTFMVRKLGRR
jgi:LPXTG-motif cell wall-anchored protein